MLTFEIAFPDCLFLGTWNIINNKVVQMTLSGVETKYFRVYIVVYFVYLLLLFATPVMLIVHTKNI